MWTSGESTQPERPGPTPSTSPKPGSPTSRPKPKRPAGPISVPATHGETPHWHLLLTINGNLFNKTIALSRGDAEALLSSQMPAVYTVERPSPYCAHGYLNSARVITRRIYACEAPCDTTLAKEAR